MKVFTHVISRWDGSRYAPIFEMWYEYDGPVDLVCGATSDQKDIGATQKGFFNTLTDQAKTVFGAGSKVFGDLMSSFSPTVAAGPNQRGFSAPERAAYESGAITNTGNAARNALQASKEASAAVGGGNMALPSGADIGRNLSVTNAAAAETANELNQINQADFAVGRQNYDRAVSGMAQAPGVFNSASTAANAATGSGEAAANTANQVAQQNNSWVNATIGALGNVAGTALTGGMNNLAEGVGFFGQNAPAPKAG